MRSSLHVVLYLTISLAASNPLSSQRKTAQSSPHNTNHIFNAIHSSMRQWGSSLNHNGMSFFLATVPKGVQFYHGTHTSAPVTGMEWLAFEPEHAMIFAGGGGPPGKRPGHGKHPGGPGQPPEEPGRGHPPKEPGRKPPPPIFNKQHSHLADQTPFGSPEKKNRNMDSGWLHTYVTNRNLRMLYLDGMSAAKSDKGTLDAQDYIILNDTAEHTGFWERERAKGMCKIAEEKWSDRIDGFIRMEAGFEMILCSFAENLDTVRITRVKGRAADGGPQSHGNEEDHFAYYRAITARYHGIGGGRVMLDFENFFTAYDYYPVDLFQTGEMPRLQNISAEAISLFRTDLDELVMRDEGMKATHDWQVIADMIVQRYATTLKYLASDRLSNQVLLHAELDRLLRPFIDYSLRNTTAETERCSMQFLPAGYDTSLASRTVASISHLICATLSSALEEANHSKALGDIRALITYLNWSAWKECGGCAVDEICFTAIWPQGTLEDHTHPSCTNASAFRSKQGYWGGPGPRD